MKQVWLITVRSVTFGQKGERALKRKGILCSLQRTPKGLSNRGCSYGLRVPISDGPIAMTVLEQAGIPYENIYVSTPDGAWEAQKP